jgi:hypothetical protein
MPLSFVAFVVRYHGVLLVHRAGVTVLQYHGFRKTTNCYSNEKDWLLVVPARLIVLFMSIKLYSFTFHFLSRGKVHFPQAHSLIRVRLYKLQTTARRHPSQENFLFQPESESQPISPRCLSEIRYQARFMACETRYRALRLIEV